MPTEVKVEYDPDPSFGIGSTSCYEIQTIQPDNQTLLFSML